ncbi:hypothetical protein [Streptomyces sp. NPDC056938]|uniref:hypothetical protein n=1 Tax=unclassified Streptomyces TaxID=2593676 RepID=UPI0036411A6D
MALLSRTVVSLDRPFEGGELIGITTSPDDLQHRLPPTPSMSTLRRGHAKPLTSHFKISFVVSRSVSCACGAAVVRWFHRGFPSGWHANVMGSPPAAVFRSSTNWPTHLVSKPVQTAVSV